MNQLLSLLVLILPIFSVSAANIQIRLSRWVPAYYDLKKYEDSPYEVDYLDYLPKEVEITRHRPLYKNERFNSEEGPAPAIGVPSGIKVVSYSGREIRVRARTETSFQISNEGPSIRIKNVHGYGPWKTVHQNSPHTFTLDVVGPKVYSANKIKVPQIQVKKSAMLKQLNEEIRKTYPHQKFQPNDPVFKGWADAVELCWKRNRCTGISGTQYQIEEKGEDGKFKSLRSFVIENSYGC